MPVLTVRDAADIWEGMKCFVINIPYVYNLLVRCMRALCLSRKALVRTACRFMARAVAEAGSRYRIVDKVWHCAALLELLYQANMSSNRQVLIGKGGDTKIPIEKFQVEELGALVDPIKEVGAYVELAPRIAQEEAAKTKQSRGRSRCKQMPCSR